MRGIRLASHAMAACSTAVQGCGPALCALLNLRNATTAASPGAKSSEGSTEAPRVTLTEAQRQELSQLIAAVQRTGDIVHRLGALTHMAVCYRDLSVAMTALQMRHRDLDPFIDEMSTLEEKLMEEQEQQQKDAANAAAGAAAAPEKPPRGTVLEMIDVTKIDENLQVDGETPAPVEIELEQEYMDKISCWAALQPPHIEMSHALMTGIKLFPPTEATYPTFVDFDAAIRRLSLHVSRKRLRLQQRLLRKQDKYQLKTWQHSPGEA